VGASSPASRTTTRECKSYVFTESGKATIGGHALSVRQAATTAAAVAARHRGLVRWQRSLRVAGRQWATGARRGVVSELVHRRRHHGGRGLAAVNDGVAGRLYQGLRVIAAA